MCAASFPSCSGPFPAPKSSEVRGDVAEVPGRTGNNRCRTTVGCCAVSTDGIDQIALREGRGARESEGLEEMVDGDEMKVSRRYPGPDCSSPTSRYFVNLEAPKVKYFPRGSKGTLPYLVQKVNCSAEPRRLE